MIQLEMILILLMVLIIIFCTLVYYSNVHWIFKSFSFTFLLLLGIVCFSYYQQNLGSPIKGYPPHNFVYVHHQFTNTKEVIIWAYNIDDKKNKLYIVPYDRELGKRLEHAKKNKTDGKNTIFKPFTLEIDNSVDNREGFSNQIPKE